MLRQAQHDKTIGNCQRKPVKVLIKNKITI